MTLQSRRSRRPPATRIDYQAVWVREVGAGRKGQRLDRTSTWRLDNVWRAACWQKIAEDSEELFELAWGHGASFKVLSKLMQWIEIHWERAHRAYLGIGEKAVIDATVIAALKRDPRLLEAGTVFSRAFPEGKTPARPAPSLNDVPVSVGTLADVPASSTVL